MNRIAVVTASIRPFLISTAVSRTGGAPVPSMSVPPSMTSAARC